MTKADQIAQIAAVIAAGLVDSRLLPPDNGYGGTYERDMRQRRMKDIAHASVEIATEIVELAAPAKKPAGKFKGEF